MCYLARLPCAEVDPSSLSDKEKRFQYELGLFDRVTNTNVKDKNIGDSMLRLFVLVLMLSNKWLEDNTYTNKTWSVYFTFPLRPSFSRPDSHRNDISGFTCASLRELEAAALACMEHNLVVSSEEWLAWLQHLRSLQVHVLSPGKAVGGEKENAGMHRRALDVLDGLIWQAGQGGMSVGLGLPSHAVQSPAVEADCSYDDQSSLDLDADGPLRDDYKPNAKVALGRSASLNGQTARTHHPRQASLDGRVQRGLPTPAQWNPSTAAFDSPQPPSRPRPQYEAIQRPVINAYCASGQDQMPQAPLIPHVVPGHFYYGQQQQNPSNAPGQQHPYAHAYPMQQTYRPEMCMPAGYGPSNPSYQPAANEQAPANSSWYNWQGMWSCPQESSFGMQAGRMGTSVVGAAVANFGARLRAF
ncbi:hypothetical protein BOTBODRAFT_268966 [Botryobasidium botryosum FD-172 SS1]|uniref:Uncharacterized protein n=1 Tax=Botryobasidium botryosum (strain FD-172 SS1) TaxID=930990 RepID=A0A067MK28_BOTB1|nr:hypothetical protein BOTBODRAFT_268966 [Botryobasidium botryosum FD-172 SS1]